MLSLTQMANNVYLWHPTRKVLKLFITQLVFPFVSSFFR